MVAEEILEDSMRDFEIRSSLRRALSDGEFELLFQPVVELRTGRIVQFEAIAHWNHPVLGFVPMAQLLGETDDVELICDSGDWLMIEAFQKLREWSENSMNVRVVIRLSSVQVRRDDFVSRTLRIVKDSEVDPSSVVFEIPGSIVEADSKSAVRRLSLLRYAGINLALGDFSIAQLSHGEFPTKLFNGVRVDIDHAGPTGADAWKDNDVRTLIDLGRNLRMNMTGKGIDTLFQLSRLMDIGCEFFQGRSLTAPLSFDDCTVYLRDKVNFDEMTNYSNLRIGFA